MGAREFKHSNIKIKSYYGSDKQSVKVVYVKFQDYENQEIIIHGDVFHDRTSELLNILDRRLKSNSKY